MEETLISVIVPVYNAESYLSKCIECLIKQNYRRLEIICINDGSTDNSLQILKYYQNTDGRIKIISKKNEGVSMARNKGLDIAQGEYVLFLDSDDWIEKETCFDALMTADSENADVVMWSYIREYPNASKKTYLFEDKYLVWDETNMGLLRRRFIGLIKEELAEPQKIDSIVTVWGKLYKRNVIGDVRFVDTKLIGNEDMLFNIMVFTNVKKAVYIPDAYSHYRKGNMKSFTHCYKSNLAKQWSFLYDIIKNHLNSIHAPDDCYEALSNRICLGLIGLGLNLAEDNTLDFSEKKEELKKILHMPHYIESLKKLQLKYFPLHWKIFFCLAKYRIALGMSLLLLIMNSLRGK